MFKQADPPGTCYSAIASVVFEHASSGEKRRGVQSRPGPRGRDTTCVIAITRGPSDWPALANARSPHRCSDRGRSVLLAAALFAVRRDSDTGDAEDGAIGAWNGAQEPVLSSPVVIAWCCRAAQGGESPLVMIFLLAAVP